MCAGAPILGPRCFLPLCFFSMQTSTHPKPGPRSFLPLSFFSCRMSSQVLKAQLRLLGHILRREENDPLRLVCFEPNTELRPRLSGTSWKKRRGRPRSDWAQVLISILCTFTQKNRNDLLILIQNKRNYHQCVERLCSQLDPS